MSHLNSGIAVIGIDIGKNSFYLVARIGEVRSCCGKSGRAVKWKRGSPIYRLVSRRRHFAAEQARPSK